MKNWVRIAKIRLLPPLSTLLFSMALNFSVYAKEQDPRLPWMRSLATTCSSCHGLNGISQDGIPSLAGKTKAELLKKMHTFRQGELRSTVMTQLLQGYTEQQLELIAEYFGEQKN